MDRKRAEEECQDPIEEDDSFVRDMYPYMWEVFGPDGWDDPSMDVYDNPNYSGRA